MGVEASSVSRAEGDCQRGNSTSVCEKAGVQSGMEAVVAALEDSGHGDSCGGQFRDNQPYLKAQELFDSVPVSEGIYEVSKYRAPNDGALRRLNSTATVRRTSTTSARTERSTPFMSSPGDWDFSLGGSCVGEERARGTTGDAMRKGARKDRKLQSSQARVRSFLDMHGFRDKNHIRSPFLRPSACSSGPLHIAVEKGDGDMVMLLLLHGADPTLRDSKGRMPHQRKPRGRNSSQQEAIEKIVAALQSFADGTSVGAASPPRWMTFFEDLKMDPLLANP